MKKNTLFVVLFAMLCLAAITAVVSADNDGYNSFCYIDQYGCWVTDWDVERDEPTGKKIYVQFWSDEAREFFMGKGSDATVAPLPRKYGAAMTMVKGDEAARGAWKSGLWGFDTHDTVKVQKIYDGELAVNVYYWNDEYQEWAYDHSATRVGVKYDKDLYYPSMTLTYYDGDGRQKIVSETFYLDHEYAQAKYWDKNRTDYDDTIEKIDLNSPLAAQVVFAPTDKGPSQGIVIDTFSYSTLDQSNWDFGRTAFAKDGAQKTVVNYCNAGHIEGLGCVIPGSLGTDIDWKLDKTYNVFDSGTMYTEKLIRDGDNVYVAVDKSVKWANPWAFEDGKIYEWKDGKPSALNPNAPQPVEPEG